MARLEQIRYVASRPEVGEGLVRWTEADRSPIQRLPQITWKDSTTWGEVNLWALEQATAGRKHEKTVASSMSHLVAYAKWLEQEGVTWWHFPAQESERCLTRYRGALIRARDMGQIAPSTASRRMAVLVRFYRWLQDNRLLSPEWPPWNEKVIGIRLIDSFGLEHTMRLASTDLAIPCRRATGALPMEDGVSPVSKTGASQIISFAERSASAELALMLQLGFFTGLRLGSITDLRVATLENATRDPLIGWTRIAVGPGARPPVATKFGVSGFVPIPQALLDRLLTYATSTRRLKRQAMAAREHRDLLFLTRFANPYSGEHSRAVNVEIMRLRNEGSRLGIDALRGFHFHRTRATFATELMRVALSLLPVPDAVQLVREACLHKDEKTTLKYVKLIETSQAMAEAAQAFTDAFMGLIDGFRAGQDASRSSL